MNVQADACVYDNMGDTDGCRGKPISEVKIVHFTVCQKPWYCLPSRKMDTCAAAQDLWWTGRWAIEETLEVERSEYCRRKFMYKPMSIPGQDDTLFQGVQLGCKDRPEGCTKF